MSLQDWLEYFEAVNGRKPSDLEIQQALAAGEFVDDGTSFVTEPVETTYDVMEEPIPTPADASDASEESVYDQQTTTPEQPLYTEQPVEQPFYTEQPVEQPLYTEQATQAQQLYYTEQGAQADPAGYTQGAGQQQYYAEQGGQPNPAGYTGQSVAPVTEPVISTQATGPFDKFLEKLPFKVDLEFVIKAVMFIFVGILGYLIGYLFA